jgi:hypothetical protein
MSGGPANGVILIRPLEGKKSEVRGGPRVAELYLVLPIADV